MSTSANSPIRIISYPSPASFLEANTQLLLRREWQNSTPLGILSQYLTDAPPTTLYTPPSSAPPKKPTPDFILLATFDEKQPDEPVLFAVKTPSYYRVGIYGAIGPKEDAGLEEEEEGEEEEEQEMEKAFQMHAHALAERLLDICGDDGVTAFNGDARYARSVAEAVITILEQQQQQVATHNGDTDEKKNKKKRLVTEELKGAIVTRSTFRSASSPPPPSSSSETHNIHEAPLPGQLLPGHSICQFTADTSEQQMERLAFMHAALFFESRNGQVLDPEANFKDVATSVRKGLTWGYLVPGEQEDVVAAALFLGRETPNGITIRTVYTAKEWRRRGFAEKMVRGVVEVLLGIDEKGKEEAHEGSKKRKRDYVMLLFIENGPAAKIYRRIGFGGDGGVDEIVFADIDIVDEEEEK